MEWLNYHHLLYFWVTAREGTVTAAAKKLHLAQPTLSAQIRQLEEDLGEPLFERRGRGLVLTETGRVVFRYADEIFGLGNELLETVRRRTVGRAPVVEVGVVDVMPKLVVAALLEPALRLEGGADASGRPASRAGVRLVVREEPLDRLMAALAAHEVDLVLSDTPLAVGSGVKAYNHLLGESPIGWYAAPALAAVADGFPRSLDGAPVLLPSPQTAMRRAVDGWLDRMDVHPRVVGELDDHALLEMFGARGWGVFPAPTAIETDLVRHFGVAPVGVADVAERFYAISVERRIKHPAVAAIAAGAAAVLRPRAAAEPSPDP